MIVRFLAQPSAQIGTIVRDLLESDPIPTKVIIVSAWAHRLTLLRLRDRLVFLRKEGATVRFVVGIDLAGTSQEALREIHSWGIDARVVKHRHAGHTFHPKLVVVERAVAADILIGSSNVTDGGFYNNYESVAHVGYSLPADQNAYEEALTALERLISPSGPTAKPLTDALLTQLVSRGEIPTEAEIRRAHRTASKAAGAGRGKVPSPFGVEDVPAPPAMPGALLNELIITVADAKKKARIEAAKTSVSKRAPTLTPPNVAEPGEITPTSFYMTLPTVRSSRGVKTPIPGEPRIPLSARNVAPEFWGWRDEYAHVVRPNAREYYNWKPLWRVRSTDPSSPVYVEPVRMYEYVNSADFRFYSPKLLALGADAGDVVRITRVSDDEAEFECVLARRGTGEHADWYARCTQIAPGGRRFGYA